MKYVYQDIIFNSIKEKAGNNIFLHSLSESKIVIGKVLHGACVIQNCEDIKVIITYGSVDGIQEKDGLDLAIDFTIYEFIYGTEYENETTCYIRIQ